MSDTSIHIFFIGGISYFFGFYDSALGSVEIAIQPFVYRIAANFEVPHSIYIFLLYLYYEVSLFPIGNPPLLY